MITFRTIFFSFY